MKGKGKGLMRPILMSILVMMGLVMVLFLAGMVSALTVISTKVTFFIAFSLVALIEIVHMFKRRRFDVYGFDIKSMTKAKLLLILPLFLIAIVPLFGGLESGLSLANILYIVIYMFIVAFVEEVLYRGIILNNLKQKSVNFAIVGSSVMFGVSHLITAAGGKDLIDVLYQVVMAITIGLILGLILHYTQNIYLCIGFHFVNNVIVSISGSFGDYDMMISYLILIALLIYLFVLRDKLQDSKVEETYD